MKLISIIKTRQGVSLTVNVLGFAGTGLLYLAAKEMLKK